MLRTPIPTFRKSVVGFSQYHRVNASHCSLLLASKVSEVRLRLTQEEAAEAAKGKESPHEVSASVFIRMGLELEDQQYVSALNQYI